MSKTGLSQLAERLSEAATYAEAESLGEGPNHRLYVVHSGIAARSKLGNYSAELRISFEELEQCVVNPLIQAIDENGALLRSYLNGVGRGLEPV